METSYFKRVSELTPTRFWINNVTKQEAQWAIDAGAIGCTQNPAYVWKMMNHKDMQDEIDRLIETYHNEGLCSNDILLYIQRELVAHIAEIFLPLYEKSHGSQGYVSIQGDPFHEDADTIIHCALLNCKKGPNIMAKIPVTQEGLKAIAYLASKGIPINATEVMAVRQALDVCQVYDEATRNLKEDEKAPIYFSHITGIYDEYLQKQVKEEGIEIHPDVLWQAGMVIAKKVYAMCKARYPQVGFIGGGARGLHHFTEMVGAQANITINWKGTADRLLEENPVVTEHFHTPIPAYVLEELCEKLPDFQRGYFVHAISPEDYETFGPVVLFRSSFESAWKNALDYIEQHA